MVHLDSGDLLTTLGPYWLSPPASRIVLKVWIRIPPCGFWGRQVMMRGFKAAGIIASPVLRCHCRVLPQRSTESSLTVAAVCY